MLLITHIILALSSLPLMALAVLAKLASHPERAQRFVKLSGASSLGLLISGVALVIIDHQKIVGACLSGITYLAGLSVVYVVYRQLGYIRSR